jgi:MlaD protein
MSASLFTVLRFGVLGFMSLQLREGRVWQSGMSHGYAVKAKFENVGSLRIGAPVKLAGVRVGRVAASGNYIAITPGAAAASLVDGSDIHTSNSAFNLERMIGQSMCGRHAGGCAN